MAPGREHAHPSLALASSTCKLWSQLPATTQRHPGLQLDKYLPIFQKKSGAKFQEAIQRPALEQVCKLSGDQTLFKSLVERRKAPFDDIGRSGLMVEKFAAVTAAPLTLHLARGAALENAGICLHPLYGFAFLPASGLKGMARAYAETVWARDQADTAAAWNKIFAVFGWAHGPNDRKPAGSQATADAASGAIIFHDAWPQSWPRLMLDIVNNHHPAYYSKADSEVGPPGDWEDPSPVTFLAVSEGQTFDFALSTRSTAANSELLGLATQWLRGALTVIGAGAKTAAGYGAFKLEGPSSALIPSPALPQTRISRSFTVELVTPAFLAGAYQAKEDCKLRSATLRGLLRWWWRTMHARHVDPPTLRRLESTV
jgi:CRISPR-associated protein Cmr6